MRSCSSVKPSNLSLEINFRFRSYWKQWFLWHPAPRLQKPAMYSLHTWKNWQSFWKHFSLKQILAFRHKALTSAIIPSFSLIKKLSFLAPNHLATSSQPLGNKSFRFEMTSKDTVPLYSFTMQSKTALLEGKSLRESWTELQELETHSFRSRSNSMTYEVGNLCETVQQQQ